MTIKQTLESKHEEIIDTCAKHGARNVRVFGSVARGDANHDSDLDLLVDFEPDRSLLDQAALILELEELLGCKVDVVSEAGLYWLLRQRILRETQVL